MKIIKISEVIGYPNAVSHSYGMMVFDCVSPLVLRGEKVVIDFSGIENLTSVFCNTSVGNIFALKNASQLVSFTSCDNALWMEKINDAIDLASHPEKKKEIDIAIADLFK